MKIEDLKIGQYVMVAYNGARGTIALNFPLIISGLEEPNQSWNHGLVETKQPNTTSVFQYYKPNAILKTYDTIEEFEADLEILQNHKRLVASNIESENNALKQIKIDMGITQ